MSAMELHPLRDLAAALADLCWRRPRVQSGPGGSKNVGPDQTIGSFEHCWCDQRLPHDWPGQADGAPHPRYPR